MLSVIKVEESSVEPEPSFPDSSGPSIPFAEDSQMTLLDGYFFERVAGKCEGGKIVAVCKKCAPNYVEIKGSRNCTSNFVTHLKRKHGNDTLEEYRHYMKNKRTYRRVVGQPFRKSASSGYCQEEFDRDVVKYFCNTMVPLECVEDPFFREMLYKLNLESLGLMLVTRHSLCLKVLHSFQEQAALTRQDLRLVEHVATSIDICSRGYLGVTAHWIDPSTLKRVSRALECQRFKKLEDVDTAFKALLDIYTNFGLTDGRILAEATDNPAASRRFSASDSDSSDTEAPLTCQHLAARLPCHLTCASHTLTLCVTTDVTGVLSEMHQHVMRKCRALWRAATTQLSVPEGSSWSSLYEALKDVLKIRDKSIELHVQNPLYELEFEYLREYLHCTKPLAEALNVLHGENSTYYGILLPTLLSLRRKLRDLTNNAFLYCGPLAHSYLQSVSTRFQQYFSFATLAAENAAVAAMSYPRVNKFKWLSCVHQSDYAKLKSLFVTAVSKEITLEPGTGHAASSEPKEEDDFFNIDSDSDSEHQTNSPRSKAEIIIAHFAAEESKDISLLNNYPEIKRVFVKYNTPLPSTVSTEKLFSFVSSSYFRPSEMFKERVVLRANLMYERKATQQ